MLLSKKATRLILLHSGNPIASYLKFQTMAKKRRRKKTLVTLDTDRRSYKRRRGRLRKTALKSTKSKKSSSSRRVKRRKRVLPGTKKRRSGARRTFEGAAKRAKRVRRRPRGVLKKTPSPPSFAPSTFRRVVSTNLHRKLTR